MADLRVYVEGKGEREFVQEVLAPHLERFDAFAQATYMGHPEMKPSGGIRKWEGNKGARIELMRALQQSSGSYRLFVTTMVDYYALPLDWPNRANASAQPKSERSPSVEFGMVESMRTLLGDDRRIQRFIPYVSLHEFEALILSKPEALLSEFPGCEVSVKRLLKDLGEVEPEDVDDRPAFAPSRRIENFFRGYTVRKSSVAINTLKDIGLEHLRARCPHFGQWLGRLEALAGTEN